MTTSPEDLARRVRRSLRDTTASLGLADLSADLAESGWDKLRHTFELGPASYGTARLLLRNAGGPREVVAQVGLVEEAGFAPIPVEVLPVDLAARCAGASVRFYEALEIRGRGIDVSVDQGLQFLAKVPPILATVCTFVRALHLIDTGDDEVDVSFSDPALPFSAFVSVPGPGAEAASLRVAEALLHEAMHLQLTLVEAVVPLVRDTGRSYFSPWRNEYRTAQGVLHALYVFRVIQYFLGAALLDGRTPGALEPYARERWGTIARQVREIQTFKGCDDLTADGTALVTRLLA